MCIITCIKGVHFSFALMTFIQLPISQKVTLVVYNNQITLSNGISHSFFATTLWVESDSFLRLSWGGTFCETESSESPTKKKMEGEISRLLSSSWSSMLANYPTGRRKSHGQKSHHSGNRSADVSAMVSASRQVRQYINWGIMLFCGIINHFPSNIDCL